MPTSFEDQTRRLLACTPVIQTACDLDLLMFLHRHPRALLTTERLVEFVGHNATDIVKSLETFIETGLLTRTPQPSAHAARMFVLLLAEPQGRGVSALLELCSTREGRERILEALQTRGTHGNQPRTSQALPSCG
jgi:hypothetical protein